MSAPPGDSISWLRAVHRKIWRTIEVAFFSVEAFGISVLLAALISGNSKREASVGSDGSTTLRHQEDTQQSPRAARMGPFAYLLRIQWILLHKIKQLFRPTSYWIPIPTAVLVLIYLFQALETRHLDIPSAHIYANACPESSRRTQTSVWVKLFAASVTTVCIHGHSGSLAESSLSWRRESFRMAQVLISPLTPIVLFFEGVWYGFIDILAVTPGAWSKNVTLRYRLARLCHVSLDAGTSHRLQLAHVNPLHLGHAPLCRDLKWFGRVLILVVLSAQYIQAGLLLTRRILSNSAATIDYALSFLVLSGLVALFRSLAISLINSAWTINPNSLPCAEKACTLPSCISFKTQQGFKNPRNIKLFGHDFESVPRTILAWIFGGHAQLTIVFHMRNSLCKNLVAMYGIHVIWIALLYIVFTSDMGFKLFTSDDNEPNAGTVPDEQALPNPANQNSAAPTTSLGIFLSILLHTVLFITGLVMVAFVFLLVVAHLYYLVAPCVMQYILVVSETLKWKDASATKPCPQLWKDGLEDELWWF